MNCPLRNKCYRFTSIPTPDQQSYFVESPAEYEFGEATVPKFVRCEMFWGENQQQILDTLNRIVGGDLAN